MEDDMYWGWIAIPNNMIEEESFWQELAGIFFPDVQWRETKHTIGNNIYILGKSDYFDDYKISFSDKLESPTYDVEFDDMNCFHGFSRTSHAI